MSAFGGGFGGFLGFHKGGMIPKAHSGIFADDERLILAQTGEGILTRSATQAMGGKAGIDYMNAYNRTPPLAMPSAQPAGRSVSISIQGDIIGDESFVKEKMIPLIEQAIEQGESTILKESYLSDVEY